MIKIRSNARNGAENKLKTSFYSWRRWGLISHIWKCIRYSMAIVVKDNLKISIEKNRKRMAQK
jgi:hypothetical protein